MLFPFADGAKPQTPSVQLYHDVGQALAQFHQASDNFRFPHPRRALDPLGGSPSPARTCCHVKALLTMPTWWARRRAASRAVPVRRHPATSA